MNKRVYNFCVMTKFIFSDSLPHGTFWPGVFFKDCTFLGISIVENDYFNVLCYMR